VSSAADRTRVRSTIQKRDAQGVIRHGAEWLALWSDPESMKSNAQALLERAESRARSRLNESLSATARALAADPRLVVEAGREGADVRALRGRTDSLALRRRFHDPELHARLAPPDIAERNLFDVCEKVRCESCGAALFPGVRENLAADQFARLGDAGLLNAHLALLVPMGEGLNMVLRDALTGAAEPSIPSQGLWMWDRWIRERFSTTLQQLKAVQHDQAAFAALAFPFLRALLAEVGTNTMLREASRDSAEQGEEGRPGLETPMRERPGAEPAAAQCDPIWLKVAESPAATPYKVFTTAHDAVVRITDILDEKRLRELRQELERKRAGLRRNLARLAARFQRRLLARLHRDWSFDLEEGLLDAARLDRVVVNPGFANAYKQERESNFPDTVVSILIDNSGSMRGKPIEISCLAADLIATALERCGFAGEILGFTTREWKGGRSAADWARAGSPPEPGRLNDLLHIVYKSAAEPVRRARLGLAGMLDPNLLKENIDGEALLWASRRLLARPEKRKILIVVSDGAPVDRCTLEANTDKQILDRHLRAVIEEIEGGGAIELAALGVKHDTTPYYRKSVEIRDSESLGSGLIGMVDRLLSSSSHTGSGF
jgi:cobaltochelatase CobT